jgi:hypothetical protein
MKIVPLICEHSERTTVKHERLKNIAIAALKQFAACVSSSDTGTGIYSMTLLSREK